MSKQSEALRMYFAENKIKGTTVAEKTGVTKGTISNILNGKYEIGSDLGEALSNVYGFDFKFLLTGEGSLFPVRSITGSIVNSRNVKGNTINTADENTAELRARIAALEATLESKQGEIDWLREQLSKR